MGVGEIWCDSRARKNERSINQPETRVITERSLVQNFKLASLFCGLLKSACLHISSLRNSTCARFEIIGRGSASSAVCCVCGTYLNFLVDCAENCCECAPMIMWVQGLAWVREGQGDRLLCNCCDVSRPKRCCIAQKWQQRTHQFLYTHPSHSHTHTATTHVGAARKGQGCHGCNRMIAGDGLGSACTGQT